MSGDTVKFDVTKARQMEYKVVLKQVYDALEEKGYNPLDQIVGYLLSEDPGYITNHKNARSLIRRMDRDELLGEIVRCYLDKE